MSIRRVNEFATEATGDVVAVSAETLAQKIADARLNPRQREMHLLHRDPGEHYQRALNTFLRGSYIRPHRHRDPPKAESVVLLHGTVGFVPFLEDGTPDQRNLVLLDRENGCLAVDWTPGVWHTFLALSPEAVVFEGKAGPYDPATDKEFAAWAPAAGSADAPTYLARLEALFL
ncbi:MAG: WbuC family cupin fold metalloprotein [Pseudomonadota bacterium]